MIEEILHKIFKTATAYPVWRLSVAFVGAAIGFALTRIVSRLMRRQRSHRAIAVWAREIASDVGWFGAVLTAIATLAFFAEHFWDGAIAVALAAAWYLAILFFMLISIAGVSVAEYRTIRRVEGSDLSDRDRRNYLTLIPLGASLTKIAIYAIAAISAISHAGVPVAPFLQASAIAGFVLGLAGQEVLKDLLATLFIFTDRLYYVGDQISISQEERHEYDEGIVLKITARSTFLMLEDGSILTINNRLLAKFRRFQRKETAEERDNRNQSLDER